MKHRSREKGHPDAEAVVHGNTQFALHLYRQLKEREGNLFFSPHSVSTALAMTYAGARGNTERQMAQALHFPLGQERLHPAFASIEAGLNAVQGKGSIQLRVANALWPQEGYAFLKEFLVLARKYYGALITPLDYGDPEAARETINLWVEEKTEEKIKDLIVPGVLDALTRLVLVNAIYFKGDWASQFDKALTEEAPFWMTPAQKVEVPMMTQECTFRYTETGSLQVLELPYVGEGLSMIVLLPNRIDGLARLEKALTVKNLGKWTSRLWVRDVQVFLPRFKMTSQFRLDSALMSLGMIDAFDEDKADFSGMDGRARWLYINAVIHKAFVDVNEEGTEAAAATAAAAVVSRARCAPPPPATFRADHPFVFLIRENLTGSILFLGRVVNPMSRPV